MEIEIGHYIINSQQQSGSGRNYELHNVDTCTHLPNDIHSITLGYFSNCHAALAEARTQYPEWAALIDGCAHCCPKCHKD